MVCLERRDENLPGSHVFVETRHRSHRCQAQNFAGDRCATHSPGSAIETGQVAGDEVGRTLQTATEVGSSIRVEGVTIRLIASSKWGDLVEVVQS